MAKTLSDPPVPADWARHTPTSDPGGSAALLEAVAPTAEAITPVIRNLTAHYRAEAEHLPAATAQDRQRQTKDKGQFRCLFRHLFFRVFRLGHLSHLRVAFDAV